jgi:hypothetical protein
MRRRSPAVPPSEAQNAVDWTDGTQPNAEGAPWAALGYFKLRETLETIVAGMEAAAQDVDSAPPAEVMSGEKPVEQLSGS